MSKPSKLAKPEHLFNSRFTNTDFARQDTRFSNQKRIDGLQSAVHKERKNALMRHAQTLALDSPESSEDSLDDAETDVIPPQDKRL